MRKHFYLITDHPTNSDHEGRIQITDRQLQNSNKNVETVSHILDKEHGEFLEKRVVSMGYVDFDDEEHYEATIGDAVARNLAEDLVDYLREHPQICADVSPVHYPYVRYRDGAWQRATRERYGRIAGGMFDAEMEVVQLFTDRPVTLTPCEDASTRGSDDRSIWMDAAEQDVFTDSDRCSWCGYSERTRDLGLYETTEDGRVRLCESCRPTWERDDQIVREVAP